MGIIRNHLKQMKVEQPEEYKKLMKGYKSEDDFVRETIGLSKKAYSFYTKLEERHHGSE